MKLAILNEYIQTTAAIGAILALAAVGYEIQQSNRIAVSENNADNWSQWISTSTALLESDIADTRARVMTNAEDITLADKINLDMYMSNWIYLHSHNVNSVRYLEVDSEAILEELYGDISWEAKMVFGSSWSRAWLVENEKWIDSYIYQAIERGLVGVPINSDIEYYNRIDALARSIE